MSLSIRSFTVLILASLGFSYVVIYGIIFAPNMENRLLFLCFIVFFTIFLWLSFNPYMKVFYAVLSIWSGWSAAPILAVVADYVGIPVVADFLKGVGGVPAMAHIAIACVAIAALAFHYLDRRATEAQNEAQGREDSNPTAIELIVWFADGMRAMVRDKDKVAFILFLLMSLISVFLFSIIFYLQRVISIPEISDDVITFSIAVTSAVVAGEAARQYKDSYHPAVNALLSFFIVASIGGISAITLTVIELKILNQQCHEYTIFKIIQIILCIGISWFGAQLGSRVGGHPEIDGIISDPATNGSIWNRLLIGEFARDTAALSILLFAAFIFGFLSEVSFGVTNCS